MTTPTQPRPIAKGTGVLPRPGERLPRLDLARARGGTLPLRHHRKEATFLVRIHGPDCGGCEAYLRTLEARRDRLSAWYARGVAVVPGPVAEARALDERLRPGLITVVADPEGDGPLAGAGDAALLLADRYGEVFHSVPAGPDHAFVEPRELERWLQYLATQCPE